MEFVKSELKNIIVFVAILGGLYLAYTFFFKENEPATTTIGPSGGGGDVGGDILPILQDIKNIKLDAKVFDDPIYKSLKNYSVELPQEEAGRANPFAPVDGSSAQPASQINIRSDLIR